MAIIRAYIESPCPSCGRIGFHVALIRRLGTGAEFIATCALCGLQLQEDATDMEAQLWEAATKKPPLG